jgi:hypothetical protein
MNTHKDQDPQPAFGHQGITPEALEGVDPGDLQPEYTPVQADRQPQPAKLYNTGRHGLLRRVLLRRAK